MGLAGTIWNVASSCAASSRSDVWIALDDEASRRSACFVQNFSSCQCARAVAGVRLHVGQATGAGMHERSTYVALHGARKHGEEQLLLAARWPREPHNGGRVEAVAALHAFTQVRSRTQR